MADLRITEIAGMLPPLVANLPIRTEIAKFFWGQHGLHAMSGGLDYSSGQFDLGRVVSGWLRRLVKAWDYIEIRTGVAAVSSCQHYP